MKKREIIKSIKTEFTQGTTKEELFTKYSGMALPDQSLAFVIATQKDKQLLSKHKVAHVLLLVLMAVITLLVIPVVISSQFPMWATALVFGISGLLIYGFIQKNHAAYISYFIFALSQSPKLFTNFGENIILNLIPIIYSLSIMALVLYLKFKYYPDMGMFRPKKVNGNYVFQNVS